MTRLILCAIAGTLALAACEPSGDTPTGLAEVPSTSPPAADTDTAKPAQHTTTEIDWAAAKADLLERLDDPQARSLGPASDSIVIPASEQERLAVPVLLPTGLAAPAAADGGVMFRPMADGYFANYPGPKYDIIVNGTNQVARAGTSSSRNGTPRYTATVAGAQVALSRYGADYLIEFECEDYDEAEGTCITEEEALAVAESLIVAGAR